MTSTKINLLILPLLVSILLSTVSKLKIGNNLNQVFYTLLSPIHVPVNLIHRFTTSQVSFIKNIPTLANQNKALTTQNINLLSENENLKELVKDTGNHLVSNFKSTLPVRLTGSTGDLIVTSSLPLENVSLNQPLVSGKILLGVVSEIKGKVIRITPLNSDHLSPLAVHTGSGQKGQFRYQANNPQLIGVPSTSPIILGDYLFTEATEYLPANLVIGKIDQIISTPQEPFQKARIKLENTLQNSPDNLLLILEP